MAILVEGEYEFKQVHDSGILRIYVKRSGGAFSGAGVRLTSDGVSAVNADITTDYAAAATKITVGTAIAIPDSNALLATEIAAFYDFNTGDIVLISQAGLSATSQIEFFALFNTT